MDEQGDTTVLNSGWLLEVGYVCRATYLEVCGVECSSSIIDALDCVDPLLRFIGLFDLRPELATMLPGHAAEFGLNVIVHRPDRQVHQQGYNVAVFERDAALKEVENYAKKEYGDAMPVLTI